MSLLPNSFFRWFRKRGLGFGYVSVIVTRYRLSDEGERQNRATTYER
jgi:hypothetical protein